MEENGSYRAMSSPWGVISWQKLEDPQNLAQSCDLNPSGDHVAARPARMLSAELPFEALPYDRRRFVAGRSH